MIKGMLLKLFLTVDPDDIKYLKAKGYNIDVVGNEPGPNFEKSLTAAIHRSDNIVTRIIMKEKELQAYFEKQENAKPMTFEELIVNMNAALKMVLPRDILLSEYNEYKKVLKKMAESASKVK